MKRMVIHADADGFLHAEPLFRGRHAWSDMCPGCNGDLSRQLIIKLAYVFSACSCGEPEYVHLVEQMWHTDCLRADR